MMHNPTHTRKPLLQNRSRIFQHRADALCWKHIPRVWVLIILWTVHSIATTTAQTSTKRDTPKFADATADTATTTLTLSSEWRSRVAYQGRDIGPLPEWGQFTSVNLSLRNGFTASLGAVYWAKANPKGIGQMSIGVGYDATLFDNVHASVGYEHWFLNLPPTNENRVFTDFFDLDLSARWRFITFHTEGFYLAGRERTGGVSCGASLPIEWGSFTVEPLATWMVGTISNEFYANNRQSKTVERSATGTLDYQFSLPIEYDATRWSLTAAAHFDVPQTPSFKRKLTPVKPFLNPAPFFWAHVELTVALWQPKK